MRNTMKRSSKLWGAIICIALGAALCAASCKTALGSSSTTKGTVSVKLPASLNSLAKSIVADFTSTVNVKSVTVKLTDGSGATTSQTGISPTAGSVPFSDVYPGTCSVEVDALDSSGATLGSGTQTGNLPEGGSLSLTVPVSFSSLLSSGTGTLSLAITWPSASATSVSYTIDSGTSTTPTASLGGGTYSATISSTLSAGSHTLALTFYNSSGLIVGYETEAVTIWKGITSGSWIDSSGNLESILAFTSAMLFDSTMSLSALTITGLATGSSLSFASATTSYDNLLTTGATISFTPTTAIAGQSISYSWDSGSSIPINSGATADLSVSATASTGLNTLVITVTAPNKNGNQSYTIKIYKAYTVSFELNDGTSTTAASQAVAEGGTVTVPATPTRTGYTFAGWYSDAGLTSAWTFATNTVSANMTLYAKWTTGGTVGVSLPASGTQPLTLTLSPSSSIYQGSTFTATCANSTLAALNSGWAWYLGGTLDSSQTGPTYTLTSTATESMIGDYIIACTVSYMGVTYSGSAKLSVGRSTITITSANISTAIVANLAGNFVLTENIDLSGTTWTPIGGLASGSMESMTSANTFSGVFDGNGHTITINTLASQANMVGLFGALLTGGTIKNLTVICNNVSISTNPCHYVGALVGYNEGTIINCAAKGSLSASGCIDVGGLVGQNGSNVYTGTASIKQCYSVVNVTGNNTVGGLVGVCADDNSTAKTITDCYARGSVTANAVAGGLIGLNRGKGVITNCYATGAVTAVDTTNAGGLVGANYGTVTTSYHSTSSSVSDPGYYLSTLNGAIPSGFSSTIWGINTSTPINNSYPYLLYFGSSTVTP
jgi:uncharacterized repeat protein (TIGR02543 family)